MAAGKRGNMADSLTDIIKERWLNPRRKRFWAIAAVLFYALFGFFAAPLIIEKLAIDFVQEDLSRTAVIEKVEVNPYVMSVRVLGFELDDSDGERLAAFDEQGWQHSMSFLSISSFPACLTGPGRLRRFAWRVHISFLNALIHKTHDSVNCWLTFHKIRKLRPAKKRKVGRRVYSFIT